MHKPIACALIGALSLATLNPARAAPSAKPGQTLTGRIKKFQCGDNCYLTITTPKGEVDALCSAKVCVPWFENQKMPARMIGRKVVVRTGTDKQFDGNYDVVGHYLAFRTITFVK
jgi:hypothetical protein